MRLKILAGLTLLLLSPAISQVPCSPPRHEYYPLFEGMRPNDRLENEVQDRQKYLAKYPDRHAHSDQALVDKVLAGSPDSFEAQQALLQRGVEAYPEMIAALSKADLEREYLFFIEALSSCPSQERDDAFRDEARRYLAGAKSLQTPWYLPTIMMILGESDAKSDTELLEQILASSDDFRLKPACSAALGTRGVYPELAVEKSRFKLHKNMIQKRTRQAPSSPWKS